MVQLNPALPVNSLGKSMVFGPCSAESYEQLRDVAGQLSDVGPYVLRAGVWKPRTRPGHFQGVGKAALEWLQAIKKEFNLLVSTEVANAEHVDQALKYEISIVWIGARTSVNPFYVQNIADALRGTDTAVMVKNPINPDLYLWLGAIERVYKAGITKLAAVHRGFSFYGNSIYRNVPRWQIPIELRRRLPGIQLLADVSHISGSAAHLLEIAQIAFDLNYHGLMVEVHPEPAKALSDADQQVSPDFLKHSILAKLIPRTLKIDDSDFNQRILELRQSINRIDERIIRLLAERMALAEEIGLEKKKKNISIFQPERWDEIIERFLKFGKEKDLSDEFIFSLIEAIHIESIHHQSRKMNRGH